MGVSEGIDAKKNVLTKKLDNIRLMKSKLHQLEASILTDENEMEKERKDILRKNADLERKVAVLNHMKDTNAQTTKDLFSQIDEEKKSLNVDREELSNEMDNIQKKVNMVNELKKRKVDSLDDLENAVKFGAERVGLKQGELKKRLVELAAQLEASKYVN